MIGGKDIVIPAIGDAESLEACLQIVQRHWADARFEDAVSGAKYHRCDEMPLDQAREVLAYANAEAEAAWDADDPDSPPNSMLYLSASPGVITIVMDDPRTADVASMLESISATLRRNE